MFFLDKLIFNFIYNACMKLGRAFGCNALEGFITYFMLIAGSCIIVFERRIKK